MPASFSQNASAATTSLRPVVLLSLAVFLGYLTVGMPLPVIPLFVCHTLGYPVWLAGCAVGIQSFATVATRKFAGALADHRGGQTALSRGLAACALAGITYTAAAVLPVAPAWQLAVLMAGRIVLGFGESMLLTGALAWGIALAGPTRSGMVMSLVGIAMFGALALGAPLGLAFAAGTGFAAVGICVTVLSLLGFAAKAPVSPTRPMPGGAVPFSRVIGRIWRPGLALGLQGVGFAAIGTFLSLFFTAQAWSGAGLALSAFGAAFILARLFCGKLPDRLGGCNVALAFFVIEAIGQGVLAGAGSVAMAMGGAALTGFGCSLIFPALGVETVRLVPAASRGTALGAYAAFQDIALGLTGPLLGAVAGVLGYRSVFCVGSIAALAGIGVTLTVRHAATAPRSRPQRKRAAQTDSPGQS